MNKTKNHNNKGMDLPSVAHDLGGCLLAMNASFLKKIFTILKFLSSECMYIILSARITLGKHCNG